jgi:hypothetical protein
MMDYGISTITMCDSGDVISRWCNVHVYSLCLHFQQPQYLVPTTNLFMHSCLCHLPFPITWNRTVGPNARVVIHIEHGAVVRIFEPTSVRSCDPLGNHETRNDANANANANKNSRTESAHAIGSPEVWEEKFFFCFLRLRPAAFVFDDPPRVQ